MSMIALIVDDSHTQRALWKYAFTSPAFALRTCDEFADIERLRERSPEPALELFLARDAEEAIRYLETLEVDLLVTDIDMPGQDGWALTAHALAMKPALPVVVLSAQVVTGETPPPQISPGNVHVIAKSEREQAVILLRRILRLDPV
jgi:CheY-like chemotaxis protein